MLAVGGRGAIEGGREGPGRVLGTAAEVDAEVCAGRPRLEVEVAVKAPGPELEDGSEESPKRMSTVVLLFSGSSWECQTQMRPRCFCETEPSLLRVHACAPSPDPPCWPLRAACAP
jgi:hypothetical protein